MIKIFTNQKPTVNESIGCRKSRSKNNKLPSSDYARDTAECEHACISSSSTRPWLHMQDKLSRPERFLQFCILRLEAQPQLWSLRATLEINSGPQSMTSCRLHNLSRQEIYTSEARTKEHRRRMKLDFAREQEGKMWFPCAFRPFLSTRFCLKRLMFQTVRSSFCPMPLVEYSQNIHCI